MVKSEYYGNEDLDLVPDYIKVRQVPLFTTTTVQFVKIARAVLLSYFYLVYLLIIL